MQVVRNALRVLEVLGRKGPLSLAAVQRELGLPKTTVHRLLGSLAEAGWARAGDDGWRVAPRAAVLGACAGSAGGLRELALPAMEKLRERTGEAIHLTVPEGRDIVLIERLESTQAVRTHNVIGARAPLYASANGKAVLATLEPAACEAVLDGECVAFTEETLTDPDRLRFEIARVRARGFAVNRGEFVPEVAAVAAAVTDPEGRAVAALSISAPLHRLPEERSDAWGPWVVETAHEVSGQLEAARFRASGGWQLA